jgi:hypothetical protein
MLTVKIHSIKNQYILSDDEFRYILANLNKPLPVMSLNYSSLDGHMWSISIYRKTKTDKVACITLFTDSTSNGIEFTLKGSPYGGK